MAKVTTVFPDTRLPQIPTEWKSSDNDLKQSMSHPKNARMMPMQLKLLIMGIPTRQPLDSVCKVHTNAATCTGKCSYSTLYGNGARGLFPCYCLCTVTTCSLRPQSADHRTSTCIRQCPQTTDGGNAAPTHNFPQPSKKLSERYVAKWGPHTQAVDF